MLEMTKVLGIDLGTSSSAVAVLADGKVRLVPSNENPREAKPFPSAVSFFEDGGCLIGGAALEQLSYNPDGTILNVKRDMGSGRQISAFGKKYSPQFVSALLLMKMKLEAERFMDDKITKAVITIPANFNDMQRQATIEAGMIAGLDVTRLVPEPVAAAVAYGLHNVTEPSKILVFDMGAGTLDVSVIDADEGFFEVASTRGSADTGGMDMDAEVAKWLLEELGNRHGHKPPGKQTAAHVNEIAKGLKIKLSEKQEAEFDEDVVYGSAQVRFSGSLNRDTFEELISDIVDRCRQTVLDALRDAQAEPADIDKVVMVGGPTKIPAIRRVVSDAVREPERGIDPYFVVASGAAIEGAVLANDENLPVLYGGLTLLSVTPLDLAEEARVKGGNKTGCHDPEKHTVPHVRVQNVLRKQDHAD